MSAKNAQENLPENPTSLPTSNFVISKEDFHSLIHALNQICLIVDKLAQGGEKDA